MSIISLLGIATLVFVMWEKFSRPEYRKMRAALFISLGLISGLPAIHFMLLYGFQQAMALASIHYMVLMGALYIIGALVRYLAIYVFLRQNVKFLNIQGGSDTQDVGYSD
jgi:adiponectin receptor